MRSLSILLFLSLFIISCGKNKEEIMFHEFMDDATIKSINMSVNDLDFNILSIKPVGTITAKDSINILSDTINKLEKKIEHYLYESAEWEIERKEAVAKLEKSKLQAVTTKSRIPEVHSLNQQLIKLDLSIINQFDILIDKRETVVLKYKTRLGKLKEKINEWEINSEKVLSNKYEVTYSLNLPPANITNTFKKIAYTNLDNSKFIKAIDK